MSTQELLAYNYSKELSIEKRNEVRRELLKESKDIKSGIIESLSAEDLNILFKIYDKQYFNNYFRDNFKNQLKFTLSKRMSRNAGKTVVTKKLKGAPPGSEIFEIVMAVKFFFNYEGLSRDKKVNGIKTIDSLHALQLVFEHELCHLIEFHLFGASDCKRPRFKKLAYNIFNHTDVYHQLPTEREIAITEYNFRPGDSVEFVHDGKRYRGIINSINKRATVMALNHKGDYRDQSGARYSKWYVPLTQLKHTVKHKE